MFLNAQSIYITGGSFSITTNNTVQGPSLDALYRRVAPNAILNAGGRADEVRCHPGTREEVIGRIEKWRDAQDNRTPPIFWLSGPAGAGKTAIVQTIAERCNEQRVAHANFFFFRTDASRNSVSPLVATLVHQLVQLYPDFRDPVATLISSNPLILDAILEYQLEQLVVIPLRAIRESSSSYVPPLLIIDGLDECESEEKLSQRRILDAFDKILAKYPRLFRLLVASRDESQIQASFNDASCQLLSLYLDGHYAPERDIRLFVNDEFKRVRMTHPLAHTLDASWPSIDDIEDIVRKSSGQFIYAATVMRFVRDSSASPALSLTRVRGAAQIPAQSRSPFSHLDAVYSYILSRVNDQQALKDILHARSLVDKYTKTSAFQGVFVSILETYNPRYTRTTIQSCLADLTPIARFAESYWLLFHHASFPDYLLDQSRSGEYFLDLDAFNFKVQPAVWKVYDKIGKISPLLGLQDIAYQGLIILHQLPPDFLETLKTLEAPSLDSNPQIPQKTMSAFQHIHRLCTSDEDIASYKWILRKWIFAQPSELRLIHRQRISHSHWPPFSPRYLAMAEFEQNITIEPSGDLEIALRPETNLDAREIAVWLNNLLHDIHRKKFRYNSREYNRLVEKWMSWAVWNDIPLDGVDDLPNALRYLRRSRAQKWVASHLKLGSRPQ